MKTLFVGGLLVLFATTLHAITANVVGQVVKLSYFEPGNTEPDAVTGTTYTLTNLQYTSVYYQENGSTFPVVAVNVPASSLSGDQEIFVDVTVPSQNRRFLTYNMWATATNPNGESKPSNAIQVTIDKLAPASPR